MYVFFKKKIYILLEWKKDLSMIKIMKNKKELRKPLDQMSK